MATQPRNTLHNFIMREAASTGGLKVKPPTRAQMRYLTAVDRGGITTSYGYVNSAPYGITMTTHNICHRNGWVAVAEGTYSDRKAVSLTTSGRAALPTQSKG